jgi:hypothetical protein
MRVASCLAALTSLALAGCAFPVDESYFFKPQRVERKATDPIQMRINGQEKITGPFVDDKFLEGRSPLLAGHLPAKIKHDLGSLPLRYSAMVISVPRPDTSEKPPSGWSSPMGPLRLTRKLKAP